MGKQYNCVNYLRLCFDSFCVLMAQILIVMCLLMISTFSLYFLMDLFSGHWMFIGSMQAFIETGVVIITTGLRRFGIIYVSVSLISSLMIVNRHSSKYNFGANKYNFGDRYYLRLCIDLICVFAYITLIAICTIYASLYTSIFFRAIYNFYDSSYLWVFIGLNSITMSIVSIIFIAIFCPNIWNKIK